ncbi:MAG TPA: CYTH and CHAD domain-containing protein [Streptosporangiaceae bacterium]|jgi:CHAD domain-containing protein
MSVSVSEIETKYDLPAGRELPDLDALPEVSGVIRPALQVLEADYYDTADLRLIRDGITLRRRSGGEDDGWHLKLPEGPDTRREIRLPLGRTGARVPAELTRLVLARTRGEPLQPVARLVTRRQLAVLLGPSGESLAEVASDEVSAQAAGERRTSRWREVEVELTGGDRELLAAAGQRLREGGLQPASRSAKLERALDGRLPQRQPGPARLTGCSTAADVVAGYLRTQASALVSLDPLVRRDEPDAVHQMRVATRRLRSTLRSFDRILPSDKTEHLAAELKWLGSVLGTARDAEVLQAHLLDRLHAMAPELVLGPVAARIKGYYAPVRAQASKSVRSALGSRRYLRLLDELDQLVAQPPPGRLAARPAAAVLPGEVRRTVRRTGRRLRRAWREPAGPARDTALHQARKAAKQARYAAEAAEPAAGAPAAALARRIKKVQSVLGEHQDGVLARRAERDLAVDASMAGESSFTYGVLHGGEACRSGQLADKAALAWRKASRPARLRWLG